MESSGFDILSMFQTHARDKKDKQTNTSKPTKTKQNTRINISLETKMASKAKVKGLWSNGS